MIVGIWLNIYMVKMLGAVSLAFGIFNLIPVTPHGRLQIAHPGETGALPSAGRVGRDGVGAAGDTHCLVGATEIRGERFFLCILPCPAHRPVQIINTRGIIPNPLIPRSSPPGRHPLRGWL